ncbi:MAG: VOC family protein, partial [Bacteroidota bacterium]
EEIDYFWEKLTANGGQESRCGWLKDQFGVSWQIIPPVLGEMHNDKNAAKAAGVMQAMMKMNKIIIADLEKAYEES